MAYKFKIQVAKIVRWLAVAVVIMSFTAPAFADQYDDQIAALKQQVNANQSQVNSLQSQKDTLQNKVALLNAQISDTTSRLQLAQAEDARLAKSLAAAQQQLVDKKAVLNESIRAIYLTSNQTPIEMLASSNNFSDFVDRQQYLQSLKTSVQDSIDSITQLKQQLESQKQKQVELIGQQQLLQSSLSSQKSNASSLIADTQGKESAYQAKISADNAQIAKLKAEQAAAMTARFGGAAGNGPACGGGYPGKWCNAAPDTLVDSWGMYNRECVSYAAWAMAVRFGHSMPYWGGRGNANEWPDNARAAGIPVNSTPSVGSVAIWYVGAYGHAMVVEAVSGSNITVSQYNYGENHTYSTMTVPSNGFTYIHFR